MLEPSLIGQLTAEAAHDGVKQLVVGAAVRHGGRLLLLQRAAQGAAGGVWELPTGKAGPGEPLDQAVAREVKAKTGLDVSGLVDYLGSFDTAGEEGKTRQFTFGVTVAQAEPVKLQDYVAYQWLPLDKFTGP